MTQKRWGLSAAQKALLWQRWKEGESLSDIGRSLDKHAALIHAIVRLRIERRFRAASAPAIRFARSQPALVDRRLRSAGKLFAMVA
ncbi:hypothetical protein SAMN04487769_1348 [Burkholderia sp. b14]|nr:hypothetical protein SAMN04487769_1348 [Burkholderia sp. b14]